MYDNLLKIFDKRFSCRNFEKWYKIPEEDIKKMLSWAYLWPSSYSLWPFELIVIDNPNLIKLIANSIWEHRFCQDCSVMIFVAQEKLKYENKSEWLRRELLAANEAHIDASIAWTYLDLVATSLWYSTVWMWYYENIIWRKILRIPNHLELLYYIAIWKNSDPNKFKKHYYNTKYKQKIYTMRYWNKYYDNK